jgi:hypothetical protein
VAAVALTASVAACGGDAPASTTTAIPTTAGCEGCRTLDVGRAPQLGAASVGVRHCEEGACAVSIRAADGTVIRATVRRGDTFTADGTWVVVSTDGDGLVVRPG